MGQVQVECTNVPRKMCARAGIGAAHMSAAEPARGRGPRGAHQAEARRGLPRLWTAAEPAPAPASPAPCRPRPGAGSLSFLYQWDFPPWSWLPAPVGVSVPSSTALVSDRLTLGVSKITAHAAVLWIRGGCHPPRGQEMKEGAGGVRIPAPDLALATKGASALCPPTSSAFLQSAHLELHLPVFSLLEALGLLVAKPWTLQPLAPPHSDLAQVQTRMKGQLERPLLVCLRTSFIFSFCQWQILS